MADNSSHRTVTVERIIQGAFTVTNARGGQLRFGAGSDTDFTPTELLLAAIAGCTAIDVDILTSRRAEPGGFEVRADADKVRDADGNRLTGIVVTFQIAFPPARTATRRGLPCRMRSRNRMTGCAPWGAPSRPAHPSSPRPSSDAPRAGVTLAAALPVDGPAMLGRSAQ